MMCLYKGFTIFVKKICMSSFHNLSVKNIERETDKAVSITFNVPENLKDVFTFKAGQYITLKTQIEAQEIRRDYSLCVPPKGNTLKVAIKEVEKGLFSNYANNTLKVGTTLEVGAPKGRFIFEPDNNNTKNIVLFAAGSGITPILSIIKCALQEEENGNVILVFGNKSPKDTMFKDELLALQQKYNNRFSIQFVYSQQDEDDAIFGRIERSTVNYIIKNKHKNLAVDAFYLCGPEAMIHTVKDVLAEHGVEDSRIHFELFKTSKTNDETKVENTETSGNTEITVTVDDETTVFAMPQTQTILQAALDKDLDAPYSCQGGICSSCIARVTEGKAAMLQNNILTESEVAEGLILTCQAHPTTAKITIDYDDV